MTNMIGTLKSEMPALLPADLRAWCGSQQLVRFVLQAQADMDSRKLRPTASGLALHSGQANAMMAVLTYGYACGLISSQEFEQDAKNDTMILYLCSSRLPSAATIKRFRRNNREQIQECLARVFQLAWQNKNGLLSAAQDSRRFFAPAECRCPVDSNRSRIENGLTSYFKIQAESRILDAIQCDSMEMDM